MPQIRQYEAPNLGLEPSETGVQAAASAGRLAGRFYNQAAAATERVGSLTERVGAMKAAEGEQFARNLAGGIRDAGSVAVQYAEHQEISHGAASFAQLNDVLTNAWNDTAKNADPNDPMVAAKFRENVLEPALENYRQGFVTDGGQKWAEARIDALRNHMFEKSAADMSTLAGAAIEQNVRTTANSLSNTAMNDPSSVPHLLDSSDALVGGMVDSSPNLKGPEAAKARIQLAERMRENIVKSGAFGAIQASADPESEATKWAKAYPEYINGPAELQLARAAKTQARTNIALKKQAEIYQKQLDELKVHKVANDAFSKNVSIDQATGKPVISPQFFKDSLDIAKNNPDAPNAATVAKTMIDWGEMQQKRGNEVITSDPATRSDLMTRMFDPNNPTSAIDILRAEADHKLGSHDAAVMRQLVQELQQNPLRGPVWHDTMQAAKSELVLNNVGLPGKDIAGEANYAKFVQTFVPEYLSMKRAGTLPPDALDINNPDSLISKSMAPFKRTPAQRMHDYISSLGGGGGTAAVTPIPVASEFKNFFSSGRAAREGVRFNPATDLTQIRTPSGQTAQVNKLAAPHFQGFLNALEAEGYKVQSLGGYADRDKRGASGPSEHAFGNAIDINPERNAQHSGRSDLPANVAELASKYGLIWGGNWHGASNDPMHFEWSGVGAGQRQAAAAPAVGAVMKGYRFLGGDPSKRESWAKVQ